MTVAFSVEDQIITRSLSREWKPKQRQAAELSNVQASVTIPAGREIIVNLLETYRSE